MGGQVCGGSVSIAQGGIYAVEAEHLRSRVFWGSGLREQAAREALVSRLWGSGMLRVLASGEVRERVGAFCVDRSDGLQRLVVDPRPANAQWSPPPRVELTSGPMLARQLQHNGTGRQRLIMCDFSDCSYNLRLPEWMCGWFAFEPVRGELVWGARGCDCRRRPAGPPNGQCHLSIAPDATAAHRHPQSPGPESHWN